MTGSCRVLGHLAHSAAESDVCSLSDAWCLCFAYHFDSQSCFNKDLLYCHCVQCSLIYGRGLNSSSQSLSFVPYCSGCSLPEALSIPWGEKLIQPAISLKERDIHATAMEGRRRSFLRGKVLLPWELASNLVLSDLAFDTHGLGLLGSLAPL